ncbi:MAG: hypothetical protein IKT58_05505 [Oscillospiraceae bacterium]|nr:hypothetical protein [Oscillospiraceae bacterium]
MKKAGIILVVLQVVALLGLAAGNGIDSVFNGGIAKTIGFFIPAIIGVILLYKAKKQEIQQEEENK